MPSRMKERKGVANRLASSLAEAVARLPCKRGRRIRRDACCRDVSARCRVLNVPQRHYKGPRHANRGVVHSCDPEGRIPADNYRRQVRHPS